MARTLAGVTWGRARRAGMTWNAYFLGHVAVLIVVVLGFLARAKAHIQHPDLFTYGYAVAIGLLLLTWLCVHERAKFKSQAFVGFLATPVLLSLAGFLALS